MTTLNGKTALVTGSTSGIGLGIALSGLAASAMVVGVNYFATPAIRMSLNYVDYEVDNVNTTAVAGGNNKNVDDGKAIIGRLQYVF